MRRKSSRVLSDRVKKVPKWARDYTHRVRTFVGAENVEELTFLHDERRMLTKLIAEQKFAKVECCGCLIAIRCGSNAEIRCNECNALIQTVPLDELEATMAKLAIDLWEEVTSERCPHCGALNVFPGFSTMDAYICKQCGEGVKVEQAIH